MEDNVGALSEKEEKDLPPPQNLESEQVNEVFKRLPDETRMEIEEHRTFPSCQSLCAELTPHPHLNQLGGWLAL